MERTISYIYLYYIGRRIGSNGKLYYAYLDYDNMHHPALYLGRLLPKMKIGTILKARIQEGRVFGPYSYYGMNVKFEDYKVWNTLDVHAKFDSIPFDLTEEKPNSDFVRTIAPYKEGELLKIASSHPEYNRRTYIYLRMENGKAVIATKKYKGNISGFTLLADLHKVHRRYKRKNYSKKKRLLQDGY